MGPTPSSQSNNNCDVTRLDNAELLSQIIETQNDVAALELDSATVMQMVVERTQQLAGADGAILEMAEGMQMVRRTASGAAAGHSASKVLMSASLSGTCALSGDLIYCADAQADPRFAREINRNAGTRSVVLVPLTYNNHIRGVVTVFSRKPNAFDEQKILGLRLMVGMLGNALSHAAEFEVKKSLLEERTASLAALSESQGRFHSAFEHAAIGMALVSLNGRWIQVNRSVCRILGYTESELLASDFQTITFPSDLDADLAYIRRLIANEIENYQMTKRYRHKLGHVVWALLSVSLVRDENEKPLYFISQIQDVSERHRMEEALRASEEEYRAMFDLAGVGKVQMDLATGRFTRVNRKFCEMLGYTREEMLCRTFDQVTLPEDRQLCASVANGMSRGEVVEHTIEKRYVRKDGSILWVNLNAAIIGDPKGRPTRSVATIEDITQRKFTERLDADRRLILEMVVQDKPLDAILTQLNEAVQRQVPHSTVAAMLIRDGAICILGSSLPPAWQQGLQEVALPMAVKLASHAWESPNSFGVTFTQTDPMWSELRTLAAENNVHACWAFPTQSNGSPTGILCVFCEHSRGPNSSELQTLDMASKLATLCIDHHGVTHQLAHLVRHDALTGLGNRIMFEDRVEQALLATRLNGELAAVMILDIDRFKSINDALGHLAGDMLLQQFAQRLRGLLRREDTLARLGGDEFAIVLPRLTHSAQAVNVAKKIVASLAEPFDLPRTGPLHVTSSIGIAISPTHGDDSPTLQQIADEALYHVKATGRNNYCLSIKTLSK